MAGTCSSINCIKMPVVVLYDFVLLPCALNEIDEISSWTFAARQKLRKIYIVNLYTHGSRSFQMIHNIVWIRVRLRLYDCEIYPMIALEIKFREIRLNETRTVSGPHTDYDCSHP